MINEAQKDNSYTNINWICGKAEDQLFSNNYSLITAGDSIHWMNWDKLFPLCKKILSRNGYIVLLTRVDETEWDQKLIEIISKFSLIRDYKSQLIHQYLEENGYWKISGYFKSEKLLYKQPVSDYINSFHSRTSLSIEDLGKKETEKFDDAIKLLTEPFKDDEGRLPIYTRSKMYWGKPL